MSNELSTPQMMNDAQSMLLEQKTPANLIRFRVGRGGKKFPFVDGAEVIRALNKAFAWDWDFETDQEEILHVNGKPFEIKVRGKLTVRTNGNRIVKMQYGAQGIEFKTGGEEPVAIADCYKGAATDALKKCASQLGLFLDLYDSDAGITEQSVEQQKRQTSQPTPTQPVRAAVPTPVSGPGESVSSRTAPYDRDSRIGVLKDLRAKQTELLKARGESLEPITAGQVKAMNNEEIEALIEQTNSNLIDLRAAQPARANGHAGR